MSLELDAIEGEMRADCASHPTWWGHGRRECFCDRMDAFHAAWPADRPHDIPAGYQLTRPAT
jgi:hypothetical protein